LIPFLAPLGGGPAPGPECAGTQYWIYSADDRYACKDEDAFNSVMPVRRGLAAGQDDAVVYGVGADGHLHQALYTQQWGWVNNDLGGAFSATTGVTSGGEASY